MSMLNPFQSYLYGPSPKKEKEPRKEGELGLHDYAIYLPAFYSLGIWGLPLAWLGDKFYHYLMTANAGFPLKKISERFEPEFKKVREMDLGNHYFKELEAFRASWKPDVTYSGISAPKMGRDAGPDPLISELKERLDN